MLPWKNAAGEGRGGGGEGGVGYTVHACAQQETQIVLRVEKGWLCRQAERERGLGYAARAACIVTAAAAAASDNFLSIQQR